MDPQNWEPLHVQVLGLADEVLDIGAELLALREVVEERGLAVDDADLIARTIRFKSELSKDLAIGGHLLAMEQSTIEALLDPE